MTVKDANYPPEWGSTTNPDITVELFATANEDIPSLTDPNEADTHLLECSPDIIGLSISAVDGIGIDGTQSTSLSELVTCTATDDNAAGPMSDSFTFTLSYVPCTNLAPYWEDDLDPVTLTDESTLTLVLPSFVEPNLHDSVNWFSTDLATASAPDWISITYPGITLTPYPGVEQKTFEIEIKVQDDNACEDLAGTLISTFTFYVTITDVNEPPEFADVNNGYTFCVFSKTDARTITGSTITDPNPADSLTIGFTTNCSFITYDYFGNTYLVNWHLTTEADIGVCTYTTTATDDDTSTGGANILSTQHVVNYYINYCNHAPTWDSSITEFEFEVGEAYELTLPTFSDLNP